MDVFILSAARTPIGKFLGELADVPAPRLGAVALAEAIKRANVRPDQIDEVIMGNVVQAGVGQAPARQAALAAGLPDTIAAYTVNKVCGSGLKAVMLGAQAIRAGDAEIVAAGGMESMSRAPHLIEGVAAGAASMATASWSMPSFATACGARSKIARWAIRRSTSRGSVRLRARTRIASRFRATSAPPRRGRVVRSKPRLFR